MKQHTHLLLASLLVSLLAGLAAYANETPGGRTGRFIFDARYIADTGSYLTNDTCHVALTKTANVIPDDTEVLVYARPIVSTNASDWVQLLPLRTIAEHPADYYLANAISNDVMVTANYVPPSPVITNFLFTTACKICLGITPTTSLPLVVPHAKAIAVDSFDSRVEYLESTGTQWIDTGLVLSSDGFRYETELMFSSTANCQVFGGRTQANSGAADSLSLFVVGGSWRFDYFGSSKSGPAVATGVKYSVSYADGTTTVNGTSVTTPIYGERVSGNTVYVFAGHITSGTEFKSSIKLYSLKIWQNGVLILDLQPVRVGNIGYMFDAVSGKLFGNAGTGAFIVGPDL